MTILLAFAAAGALCRSAADVKYDVKGLGRAQEECRRRQSPPVQAKSALSGISSRIGGLWSLSQSSCV